MPSNWPGPLHLPIGRPSALAILLHCWASVATRPGTIRIYPLSRHCQSTRLHLPGSRCLILPGSSRHAVRLNSDRHRPLRAALPTSSPIMKTYGHRDLPPAIRILSASQSTGARSGSLQIPPCARKGHAQQRRGNPQPHGRQHNRIERPCSKQNAHG